MMDKPCLYLHGDMLTKELEEISLDEETEIKITLKKVSESLKEDEKGNKSLAATFEVCAIDGQEIDDEDDEDEDDEDEKKITVKVQRY
jgi:hypothetical protein